MFTEAMQAYKDLMTETFLTLEQAKVFKDSIINLQNQVESIQTWLWVLSTLVFILVVITAFNTIQISKLKKNIAGDSTKNTKIKKGA